jgi:hypothetical protein
MQFPRLSRAGVCLALLTVLSLATVFASAATAAKGNDFTGYFDISGVHEQGDSVQVTLHLKLYNHDATAARSVIVTLLDSSPLMTLRGNFQPVKVWKSQQFIEMSQEFTISKREFGEWMRAPAQPNLVILYQDAKGQTWQKGAEISRRPLLPVGPDNQPIE